MVNQTSRFDAQDQNSRLDAHEQQIKQLQSDVIAIKDSLKALHDDRSDSREFQKFVFNWMHHQDSRSTSRSTSHLPASSSDSSLQCVIAKLEEIVSRSEERWYGKEHQFQVGHLDESGPPISDSATIIYVEEIPAEASELAAGGRYTVDMWSISANRKSALYRWFSAILSVTDIRADI
ncbi:hypothetical protein HanIR_Chr10g0473581 [Helianthus annuus]|nr:hypothetical protein HanIR_Chr10g0473581 [Helianthus annuus]